MPRRELWLSVNGCREVTGHVDIDILHGKRTLVAQPLTPVNPKDLALTVCESTIQAWGHNPIIGRDGIVKLSLARNDTYGLILREIARAYFLALNSPNPRRPRDE